jgi:hypothetical protein
MDMAKPRRCYTEIFADPSDEEEDLGTFDWIEGFAKHIEVEYLIEKGK